MTDSIHLADLPFVTIQGEGVSAGRPALFIRVQGCSVGCQWCDTKYSWSEDPKKGHWVLYSSIEKQLNRIPKSTIIVITGGEPFEHVKTLCSLLDAVDTGIHEIEVETSGYIFDQQLMSAVDQVTLSPKVLPSALVKEDKRMTSSTAARWRSYDDKIGGVTWKFVIRDAKDFDDFLSIVQEWNLPQKKIYLMPEAVTAEENLERGRWLADVCKDYGFNLSLRQHILLWGPRRGV